MFITRVLQNGSDMCATFQTWLPLQYRNYILCKILGVFHNAGIWNFGSWYPSVKSAGSTFVTFGTSQKDQVSALEDLCESYDKSARTILSAIRLDVSEKGTLRVNRAAGTHYTCAALLEALQEKEDKAKAKHLEQIAVAERQQFLELYRSHLVDHDTKGVDTAVECRYLEELNRIDKTQARSSVWIGTNVGAKQKDKHVWKMLLHKK